MSADNHTPIDGAAPAMTCLSDFEIAAYLDGGADEATHSRHSQHLTQCARCASELTLMQSFLSATPSVDEESDLEWIEQKLAGQHFETATEADLQIAKPTESEPFWKRWLWPSPIPAAAWAAAGVLIVAGMGVYWQNTLPLEVGGPRGGNAPVYRSASIDPLAPVGEVAAAPVSLDCSSVDGAAKYRFEISEVDRTVIWSDESEVPSIQLPKPIRDSALPGKTLAWKVYALDEAGDVLATSEATTFQVTGP